MPKLGDKLHTKITSIFMPKNSKEKKMIAILFEISFNSIIRKYE